MSKWENAKLGYLCEAIFSGGTPATSESTYWNGDLLWLSSGETRSRFLFTTDRTITQEGVDNSSTRLAQKNDIVMACAGQGNTRGQTSIVLRDMFINQSVIALRVDHSKLDYRYLFYNLTLRYDELRVISDASSTRGSITTEMLKKLSIALPQLKTQARIADILSAYDDAIENNNRRIALLEKAAREIYNEWFVRMRFPGYEGVKIVNGLPEGWEVKRLKDISAFKYGTMPNVDKLRESGYPIFSGYRITGRYSEYMFEKEHLVLIARGVGGTGEVRISPPFCYLTNLSIAFLLYNDEYMFYLYEMFQLQNLRYLDTGAAQSQITIENLCRCKVVVPTYDLLAKYSHITREIYNLKIKLQTQSQNLAHQRDLLLPRLMSGKLEV
ncbi:MAG: restriction endonuclease subunit S [Oscillospiraceae bacterium]|jgi:type I restriction enzyme S subunit|nr:restriction endonuclease subunit S [Oscillospiraceae bacterium]